MSFMDSVDFDPVVNYVDPRWSTGPPPEEYEDGFLIRQAGIHTSVVTKENPFRTCPNGINEAYMNDGYKVSGHPLRKWAMPYPKNMNVLSYRDSTDLNAKAVDDQQYIKQTSGRLYGARRDDLHLYREMPIMQEENAQREHTEDMNMLTDQWNHAYNMNRLRREHLRKNAGKIAKFNKKNNMVPEAYIANGQKARVLYDKPYIRYIDSRYVQYGWDFLENPVIARQLQKKTGLSYNAMKQTLEKASQVPSDYLSVEQKSFIIAITKYKQQLDREIGRTPYVHTENYTGTQIFWEKYRNAIKTMDDRLSGINPRQIPLKNIVIFELVRKQQPLSKDKFKAEYTNVANVVNKMRNMKKFDPKAFGNKAELARQFNITEQVVESMQLFIKNDRNVAENLTPLTMPMGNSNESVRNGVHINNATIKHQDRQVGTGSEVSAKRVEKMAPIHLEKIPTVKTDGCVDSNMEFGTGTQLHSFGMTAKSNI